MYDISFEPQLPEKNPQLPVSEEISELAPPIGAIFMHEYWILAWISRHQGELAPKFLRKRALRVIAVRMTYHTCYGPRRIKSRFWNGPHLHNF